MENRLTQDQLNQVFAEVERLSQRREAELDPEQVKQILQKLNLPPELLDEAFLQLYRRQASAAQQRRNRWIAGGVVAASLVAIAGIMFLQQQQALSRVEATQDRITLVQDNGGLTTISRQTNPEVFYRVTIKGAPLGKKLSLSCDWIDASGKVVYKKRYETGEIDKPIWDTQCSYQIGTDATRGSWKVQMSLENRLISNASFEVN